MPYLSLSEARIKKLKGIPLTLAQVNAIAAMADAIGGDKGWPIAISNFEKAHKVSDGKWVEDSEKEKEFSDTYITKQANGKYWITAVSTAAMRDREGETFTTQAIDYDIAVSKETKQYPEFRVFHSRGLGIGKVEKMSRVGIFAIDEGESYGDPFSLDVCEKMLSNNVDGKWRVSRGFRILEASGKCPDCGEDLVIRTKQMKSVGFRCPTCKSIQLGYKGSLGGLRFLKAKTFDITITDTPAVPWTGVSANPVDLSQMEVTMGKKELKERLLKAGLSEEKIDERLNAFSADALKEFDGDIPDAILLKEFQSDKKDEPKDPEPSVFTLDPECLKEFSKIAADAISKQLEGLEVEVEEDELKEVPGIVELAESVESLKESMADLMTMVKTLSGSREKEDLDEESTPRNALKVLRMKAKMPMKKDPEDDSEDGMDDEDSEDTTPDGKKKPPFGKKQKEYEDEVVIMGPNGQRMKSMTELISGGD